MLGDVAGVVEGEVLVLSKEFLDGRRGFLRDADNIDFLVHGMGENFDDLGAILAFDVRRGP